MRITAILILLCLSYCILTLQNSPGCGKSPPITKGSLVSRFIDVVDPNFTRERSYITYVPNSYDQNTPMPLFVHYHGQYGNANADAKSLKYTNYDLISVYLQGLNDGNCGTGWNVGSAGHKETCNNRAGACCYDSCKTLGYCTGNGRNANCGWSTCYDDVSFTRDLINSLGNELCIDLDGIYAQGWSNGGMMIHWLATEMPGTFSSLMPIYGLPLKGFTDVPKELKGTSILSLHARSDTVIPVEGGTADGWIYESTTTILGLWANVHGCSSTPTSISTPYDGGSKNFACKEYTGCTSGKRVLRCLYDGFHGSTCPNMEAIAWWFYELKFTNTSASE